MTIRKGSPYGEPGHLPAGAPIATDDAQVRGLLEAARARGETAGFVGVTGGDLCRTLGGIGALEARFPVDVGEVLLDGRHHLFVAHLVARTRAWSDVFVAMNAQWLGRWNLGPKAHPGDGLLDTYRARLSPADRVKVRARLHHGAHLPHPGIVERRVAALQVDGPRGWHVWLDGTPVGTAEHIAVHVQPDALTVVA